MTLRYSGKQREIKERIGGIYKQTTARWGVLDGFRIKMRLLIQRLQALTACKLPIFPHTAVHFHTAGAAGVVEVEVWEWAGPR